jgi:hypothetical protein
MRSAIQSEVFPLPWIEVAVCTRQFHCLIEHGDEKRPGELLAAGNDAAYG